MPQPINPITGEPFKIDPIELASKIESSLPVPINPITGERISPVEHPLTTGVILSNNPSARPEILKQDPNFGINRPDQDERLSTFQPILQQWFRGLEQFETGFQGGFMMALGTTLDIEQGIKAMAGTETEYSNFLYDSGKEILESGMKKNPIYRENPDEIDFGDAAFWTSMIGQSGLSAGIIAESAVETLLVSAATGGTGTTAAIASNLAKIKNLATFTKLLTKSKQMKMAATSFALIRRQHESVIEAAEAKESAMKDYINRGFSYEKANELSSKAAAFTYRANLPLMALDAVSFGAMTYNPVSGIGKGVLDKALNPIKSKIVKGLVAGAISSTTEAGEEMWQFIGQSEGKAYADRMAGIETGSIGDRIGKNLGDTKFWESGIQGALLGPAMQTIGGGFRYATNKKNRKEERQVTDAFTQNITSSTLGLIDKIRKAEESENYALAGELRRELAINSALKGLMIDDVYNKSTGYDAHISYLEKTLEDVNNNNREALDKMKIDDATAEHIKETFPQYIEDSKRIKEIYQDAREDNTVSTVAAVTRRKYEVEQLHKEKAKVAEKLSDIRNLVPGIENVSDEGKRYYDAMLNKKRVEWQIQEANTNLANEFDDDKTDALKKFIEVKQAELQELEEIEQSLKSAWNDAKNSTKISDKKILESLEYGKYNRTSKQLSKIEKQLAFSTAELGKYQNPKMREQLFVKQLGRKIKNASITELDTIINDDTLPSEFQTAAAKRKMELLVKQQAQSQPKNQAQPKNQNQTQSNAATSQRTSQPVANTESVDNEAQLIETSLNSNKVSPNTKSGKRQVLTADQIASVGQTPQSNKSDESSKTSIANAINTTSDIEELWSEEELSKLSMAMKSYREKLSRRLNKEATLYDVIEDLIKVQKRDISLYGEKYQLLEDAWTSVFGELSSLERNRIFADFFDDITSEIGIIESELLGTKQVAKSVVSNGTQENTKVEGESFRLGFTATEQIVSIIHNPDGTIQSMEFKPSTELSEATLIDLSIASDYSFGKGQKLTARVFDIEESRNVPFYTFEDVDGKQSATRKKVKFGDMNFEYGSEEWINNVPIILYNEEGIAVMAIPAVNDPWRSFTTGNNDYIAQLRKDIFQMNDNNKEVVIEITNKILTDYAVMGKETFVAEQDDEAMIGYRHSGNIVVAGKVLDNEYVKDFTRSFEGIDQRKGTVLEVRKIGEKNGRQYYGVWYAESHALEQGHVDGIANVLQYYYLRDFLHDATFMDGLKKSNAPEAKRVLEALEWISKNNIERSLKENGWVLNDSSSLKEYLAMIIPIYSLNTGKAEGNSYQENVDKFVKVISSEVANKSSKTAMGISRSDIVFHSEKGSQVIFAPNVKGSFADKVRSVNDVMNLLELVKQSGLRNNDGNLPKHNVGKAIRQKDKKYAVIGNNGNFIFADQSGKPKEYNSYLVNNMRTNIKGFKIKNTKFTLVNPSFEMKIIETKEITESKVISKIQESGNVKPELDQSDLETIKHMRSLGWSIEDIANTIDKNIDVIQTYIDTGDVYQSCG
jgi:hypothetical protein